MSENSKKKNIQKFDISSLQRYMLYALSLILPLAIIPLSWDWNERAMSLSILIFSTLIIGLELVKLTWYGKISILKTTLDTGIFLLTCSFTISTILSKDVNTSLWGIDNRLGNGLIILLTISLLSIVSRSFLTDIKHIKTVLFSFLIGTTICNILSIFTFVGINIWENIPLYKNFFQTGLPLIKLTKAHLLTNITTLVISFGFIGEFFISKSKKNIALISAFGSIVAITNILMYSIVQGLWIVILFLVIFVLYNLLILKKLKLSSKSWKSILVIFLLMTICISIPFALLQIPDIRNRIIPENFNLIGQVFLGQDISWKIFANMFVQSWKSAILGLGTDTYSIAYNMFKPLSTTLTTYNHVTFYHAGSEFFTQLTNGGMLWVAVWIYIGFLIFKTLISDIKNIRLYKDKRNTWYLMIISLLMITIFLSSLTAVYSVINVFTLILLFSLHAIVKNILIKDTSDKFVFKLWAMNSNSSADKDIQNIGVFFTILVGILVVGLNKEWISKVLADAYVLKAESSILEEIQRRGNSTQGDIEETSEQVLTYAISKYSKASELDKGNALYMRKLSMLYLEEAKIKAKKYLSADEDKRDPRLYDEVNTLKNYAIDSSKKSIDLSKNVYANWENNINIHMELAWLGYKDSISDAITSINQAITLNPFNYELYYRQAQLHIRNKETDNAIASLKKSLSINPVHIPSYLLTADLYEQQGNLDISESYLRTILKILDDRGKTNSDVYKETVNKLEKLVKSKKNN